MADPEYVILRNLNQKEGKGIVEGLSPALKAYAAPPKPDVEVSQLKKEKLEKLRKDKTVVGLAPVMPIMLIRPTSIQSTNGGKLGSSWGLEAVGVTYSPYSGKGVTVAVIDSGIDNRHEAFKDVNILEEDFTGTGKGDSTGHGTHCAGTIFGRDVNKVRIGIARGVKTALSAKVFDNSGNSSTGVILKAIQWAIDRGAHIISMSLGFDFPGMVARMVDSGYPVPLATSSALSIYRANMRLFDAVAAMARHQRGLDDQHDAILIAASGNESTSEYRISVAPPAAADGFVSVGALQRAKSQKSLSVADFSNTDPTIAAPGVDIVSAQSGTKRDLVAMSGTSMATPHVTGVAALWAEKLLNSQAGFSAQNLTAQLIATASLKKLAENVNGKDVGVGIVQSPAS